MGSVVALRCWHPFAGEVVVRDAVEGISRPAVDVGEFGMGMETNTATACSRCWRPFAGGVAFGNAVAGTSGAAVDVGEVGMGMEECTTTACCRR